MLNQSPFGWMLNAPAFENLIHEMLMDKKVDLQLYKMKRTKGSINSVFTGHINSPSDAVRAQSLFRRPKQRKPIDAPPLRRNKWTKEFELRTYYVPKDRRNSLWDGLLIGKVFQNVTIFQSTLSPKKTATSSADKFLTTIDKDVKVVYVYVHPDSLSSDIKLYLPPVYTQLIDDRVYRLPVTKDLIDRFI